MLGKDWDISTRNSKQDGQAQQYIRQLLRDCVCSVYHRVTVFSADLMQAEVVTPSALSRLKVFNRTSAEGISVQWHLISCDLS